MRIRSAMFSVGLALGTAAIAPAIVAAPQSPAPTRPMTPQQQKMADCSHQSTGMSPDAHKKFMAACLAGSAPAGAAMTPQQQKMKSCNADATSKGLKGADRKAFMSTCLKG